MLYQIFLENFMVTFLIFIKNVTYIHNTHRVFIKGNIIN